MPYVEAVALERSRPGGSVQAFVSIFAAAFAGLAAVEAASVWAGNGTALDALFAGLSAAGAGGLVLARRRERQPQRSALRRALEALRSFDAAVILLSDSTGRILFVNDAAAAVYGRPCRELLGLRLGDLRHASAPALPDGPGAGGPDDRAVYASVHERGDGTPFHVEVATHPLVLDGAGHALTIVRDVTEERLARAAMEEGVEQHRAVFQQVPMVQFTLDADGRFTLVEGHGLELLRLRPGEVVGRRIFDVAAPLPELIDGFLRALGGSIFSGIYRVGRHSFDVHWAPLLREDGTIRGVSGLGLDVTARVAAERARKETETRLVAAERLASMGRLAAGVAHEINNPLAWVMSNLEVAVERVRALPQGAELEELLGEVKLGAERVRDIVRDLRVFARAEGETGGGCDAASVARASLAMARNELRHRAQVETHFEAVPRVAIPERQLGQVLVNLLVNAAQAIRDGSVADNRVRVAVRPDRDGVKIEVEDTGCGMAPEVRDRIFEPFFSTKTGEGMGLGLALSQTMVQEAGGRIAVESAPGRGSTFRVWLPAAAGPPAASGAGAPGAVSKPEEGGAPAPCAAGAGRSRLLVVDDEPLIGKTVARALAEHDVEYVADAREALVRIHGGGRYDALICDLMMPEMTGMDLAKSLAEEDHALARRMIFLTGGAFTDRARAFIASTRSPVVEKPFERALLKQSVDAVLAG